MLLKVSRASHGVSVRGGSRTGLMHAYVLSRQMPRT
jgi:hypothetical protein